MHPHLCALCVCVCLEGGVPEGSPILGWRCTPTYVFVQDAWTIATRPGTALTDLEDADGVSSGHLTFRGIVFTTLPIVSPMLLSTATTKKRG